MYRYTGFKLHIKMERVMVLHEAKYDQADSAAEFLPLALTPLSTCESDACDMTADNAYGICSMPFLAFGDSYEDEEDDMEEDNFDDMEEEDFEDDEDDFDEDEDEDDDEDDDDEEDDDFDEEEDYDFDEDEDFEYDE